MTSFELETFQKELPPGARIISNSEVDAFLTCQEKHRFGFLMNKEPKYKSRSLSIGIIGHEIVAEYYRRIMAGESKLNAKQAGMKLLTTHMATADSNQDIDVIAVVQALFNRYVEQDSLADFTEILAVEKDFYLPINETFWYGMRLDLLVRSLSGRSAGNIFLVDHKFTYDFNSFEDLKLNIQMPKYIGVLRNAGIPVHDGYLNQFRTRFPAHLIAKKTDEDLFLRSACDIKPMRIRNAFKQQIIASERIMERRALPPELQEMESLIIGNRMVCKNCPFTLPCTMHQEGIDITSTMATKYQDRTYGYQPEELES